MSEFTEEEAGALSIPPHVVKLLGPEDIANLRVLPIGLDGETLYVARDANAPENFDRTIRMLLGVRSVESRDAARSVMELLVSTHFAPLWESKGWEFAGFGEPPEVEYLAPTPDLVEEADNVERPPSVAIKKTPAKGPARSVVLFVEDNEEISSALSRVLEYEGFDPRYAVNYDEVAREIQIESPEVVVARRDGPVRTDDLIPLVESTYGKSELRVVPNYGRALTGQSVGDERIGTFVFNLARFFLGVLAGEVRPRVDRAELRARLAERTARRLGLRSAEFEAVRLAAILGDLNDLLSGAESEELGEGAGVLGPLLDSSQSPFPIDKILETRTERYDGSGPKGLLHEQIPLGARILAAADLMSALKLEGEALQDSLREAAGTHLDPRVVEGLLQADRAEMLVDQLDEDRPRIILIEPDKVESSLIELRLGNAGFSVECCRDGQSAYDAIASRPPLLVISETNTPALDGFSLLMRLRREEEFAEIPVILATKSADRGTEMRALELGADDFMTKPLDLEILIAKSKALIRKAEARRPVAQTQEATTQGIAGDLSEMGLVDLLQVLGSSGRDVRVTVTDGETEIGEIILVKGKVAESQTQSNLGVPAFNELLVMRHGRFSVVSCEPPENPSINAPVESLLLEACRILDESSR